GYMQNCNVAPDVMIEDTANTTLQPDGYAGYVYNDVPGRQTTRGVRCLEIFPQAFHATPADGLAWALDEKWIRTEEWLAALRRALNGDGAERSASFRAV